MAAPNVQLDFLRPVGKGSRLGLVFLLLGLAAGVAALTYQRELRREIQTKQTQLDELRAMSSRSLPSLGEREADTPLTRDQLKKANVVLQQMNVPWGDLFAAIEASQDAGVALLAVQPDARSRGVSIVGEAKALTAVFGYMEKLERTHRLKDVILASHEIKAKDPGQPVAFTVNAVWQEGRR